MDNQHQQHQQQQGTGDGGTPLSQHLLLLLLFSLQNGNRQTAVDVITSSLVPIDLPTSYSSYTFPPTPPWTHTCSFTHSLTHQIYGTMCVCVCVKGGRAGLQFVCCKKGVISLRHFIFFKFDAREFKTFCTRVKRRSSSTTRKISRGDRKFVNLY